MDTDSEIEVRSDDIEERRKHGLVMKKLSECRMKMEQLEILYECRND